jgi:2-polyprenyl-6-hydroxyphenyl methylase/3-demethylubiquinone-9 3-methyltransferase
MSTASDPTIYDSVSSAWWTGSVGWVRTLANLVPARLRYFDRIIPHWRDLDVLDVGCAGGFLTEALARRGARVSGIDPAGEVVAAAREHAAGEGLAVDYVVGGGEALPWQDASFDVVTCVDVLEHVRDLDEVLGEVARVLRPDGWFLFDTINRNLLSRLLVISARPRRSTFIGNIWYRMDFPHQ